MFEKTFLGRLVQSFFLKRSPAYTKPQLGEDQVAFIKDGLKNDHEGKKYKMEYKWFNIIFLALIHIVALIGILRPPYFTWKIAFWGLGWGLLSTLGVTTGAHRLWSHKSYKVKTPLKVFLLFCYSTTGQNNIFEWVRDHRVHHKYSDTDADPHNATRGFFFSHVGWLMVKKHPEVLEKGKAIDMSDIENDPLLAWHARNFITLQLLASFVIPSIVPPYLWGESWAASILTICFIKYVAILNITWSVNSAAHIWGKKPFDKDILPCENPLVALVSFGEGWHNYHHAFPWDYKAQELGPYGPSFSTMFIELVAKYGLAYDLKQPSKELIAKVAQNRGDGTWHSHEVVKEDSKLD